MLLDVRLCNYAAAAAAVLVLSDNSNGQLYTLHQPEVYARRQRTTPLLS